jgi:hypothetical protein
MGRKGLDVLNDIADQLGWLQLTTVENADQLDKDARKLIRTFNRVLRAVSGIEDWHFLREQAEITLLASYEVGVCRMTNGSTAVTGLDDPDTAASDPPVWTSAMEGRTLLLSSHPVPYIVDQVNTPTSLTLNRAYLGDTTDGSGTPDLNYKIVQDRYDLPLDFDRPVDQDWTRYDNDTATNIRVVSPAAVRDRRQQRTSFESGDPDVVTIWEQDDQGEHRQAIFDQYPDTERLVRFDYQKLHPQIELDNQRILFQQKHEELLMSGVEFLALRGPEDDTRAEMMLADFLAQQNMAVARQEIGKEPTILSPSQRRAYQQRIKWRRKGRRIDWGSYFDRANFYDL